MGARVVFVSPTGVETSLNDDLNTTLEGFEITAGIGADVNRARITFLERGTGTTLGAKMSGFQHIKVYSSADASVLLFSGLITNILQQAYERDNALGVKYLVTCHGWQLLLSRIFITTAFVAASDATIIANSEQAVGNPLGIIFQANRYHPYQFVAGTIEASALAYAVPIFNYQTPTNIINDLAAASGWIWWVGHNLDVNYVNPANLPLSDVIFGNAQEIMADADLAAAITAGDKSIGETLAPSVAKDYGNIINQVTILGGVNVKENFEQTYSRDYFRDVFSETETDDYDYPIRLGYEMSYNDSLTSLTGSDLIRVEVNAFPQNREPDDPLWIEVDVVLSSAGSVPEGSVVWDPVNRTVYFGPEFRAAFDASDNLNPPYFTTGFYNNGVPAVRLTANLLEVGTITRVDNEAIRAAGGIILEQIERDPSLVSEARIQGRARGILLQNRFGTFQVTFQTLQRVEYGHKYRFKDSALGIDEVMLCEQVTTTLEGRNTLLYDVVFSKLGDAVSPEAG